MQRRSSWRTARSSHGQVVRPCAYMSGMPVCAILKSTQCHAQLKYGYWICRISLPALHDIDPECMYSGVVSI
jgi:hypothetical protein